VIVVVAAAITDGTPPQVLAGQRSYPPELAGYWELPGGKVDVGERELDALTREVREELGVDIVVGARLGADLPIVGGDGVLRVWWARLAVGEPRALEHEEVRWISRDEAAALRWLPSDQPLVAALLDGWPVD
jgi:8-oxo-dGTP diphosphatase